MTTKYLQTLNFKFNQVMFNSLVLTRERNFEVTFGMLSVLVFQMSVLESYLDIYIYQSFTNLLTIFRLYQKIAPQICLILHRFNLYVLLVFVEKKLVTIKYFLLNFFGRSKCVTKWRFLLIF